MQVYAALKDFLWSPASQNDTESLFSVAASLRQRLQQDAEKEQLLAAQLQQSKAQFRAAMQEDSLGLLLSACQGHKATQQQIACLLLQQQMTRIRERMQRPGVDEALVSLLDDGLTMLQQRSQAAGEMKQAALDVLPLATVEAHLDNLSKEIYAIFERHVGTSFAEDPDALVEISVEAGLRIQALIKMLQLCARLSNGNDDGPRFARKIADCLSPFIGKFHFHLSVNSSGEMAARIGWVFDYTETFLRFITQVWRAICPAEGTIHLTDQSSIYEVTLRMLCQKVMGLVKIQVANILEELLELHKQAIAGTAAPAGFIEVVERSLSADRYVQYLLSTDPNDDIAQPSEMLSHVMGSGVVEVPNNVSCAVVICEAPEAMDMFIDIDKASISKKLLECLSSDSSFTTVIQVPVNQSAPKLQSRQSTLSCVRGVYDLVWLVRIVSARYTAISGSHRGAIIREVLQPLLWTVPAVLLWWVRSVAEGIKSEMIGIAKNGNVAGMLRVMQMLDSFHFVERALLKEASSDLGIVVHRIKSVWEAVQSHASSAATFHSQRSRHASQITVRPRSAGNISAAVSAKPLGVLVRNLFEMASLSSPTSHSHSGFATPTSGLASPSNETANLPQYICTLVHALREGVAEELKDAIQHVMFEACKSHDLHRVINQAYDIAGVIRDCCHSHALVIGDAGQSAVVVTAAKVFNQAILKTLVERVGVRESRDDSPEEDVDIEQLRGLVDLLCASKLGNALRAEVAQALGESGDAIKLLGDDWNRVSGLWSLLDMEVETFVAEVFVFGVADKEVELGEVLLGHESPSTSSSHPDPKTPRRPSLTISSSNTTVADKGNLIEHLIADYNARPVTSELGGQLPSLASDALKSYGINFLSPRLAHAVMRSRVELTN